MLKALLRNIMWTACYVSRAILQSFEDQGKENKNRELINSILASRLLSGGLPTSCFPTAFSAQFNKRFIAIVSSLHYYMGDRRSN